MQPAQTAEVPRPRPTAEELKMAYRVAVRSRATEEFIVRLVSRGEVKFAIWGPGEEVHGTAAALAFHKSVNPEHFAFVPHYRSGSLCSMWYELRGGGDFSRKLMRQQFSKDSDGYSRGRQMVNHLIEPDIGILPVQSPVGMQLGKAAGYAMGYKLKGIRDGMTMAVIGDGTTAESDLHEAMNAASVWELPLLILVTDNAVAISTQPSEGRGIKNFAAYAEAFGMAHFSCDGRDFHDSFQATCEAASYVREAQAGAIMHVQNLPRLNGHSSAADVTFDIHQADPLLDFGQMLVKEGILGEDDVLRRKQAEGRDFFTHHDLGTVMDAEASALQAMIDEVREEPEPPVSSIEEGIYPPFPEVRETPGPGQTSVSYAGAIRAALRTIIDDKGGVIWGQDVARLGGVMTATAGLKKARAERIIDAPLNEPLIVGTACGAGLHEDIVALPEIQFGDYSLNAMHWLVHLGNLYWSTNRTCKASVILRMPTDPFGGGAIYHSMSVDGYFTPIPGLVVLMPSTSFDAYGLLLTAADYGGPVVVLEPKWMYRQALGPAFPGEPTDAGEIATLKKRIMRGEVPELDPSLRVPFSQAAVRRAGEDVTIVAWGRAVWTALRAADALSEQGVDAEVIDLRTLVPPDLDTVFGSVARTGRLIVAAEDRPFAGFVRAIQGAVVERFPGMPTRALGQKNVPGIAQSPHLEEATVLTAEHIVEAATGLRAQQSSGASGWSWIPPRYLHA
ncbi:thiamine pyrophosphate-dependent enzyme [Haliangium ochraceum]|uniref:3-methyl-2-oxobutanoate dehydrogenase (2-methylpropanoyl-transferring) n=1 Tax=Haliangium ochraceum (strain DSM 14365 / JCM 11303 / SMP-2) TaxID=502025 RepID=D0LM06_HALO1|nr:thiamine pyrophosphate-dependent enzyme [Haliangium ochraceum]ACY15184.1 Transketolase domain protein [Haliangium ochraceum DSM 14365]